MNSKKDLLYDYRFNIVDSTTKWAFNWDYSEGGTAHPVPKEHHATVFLTMNVDSPLGAVRLLFRGMKGCYPQLQFKVDDPRDAHSPYTFTVVNKRTKEVVLTGHMANATTEEGTADPNVGNFATFESTTAAGRKIAQDLVKETSIYGTAACIPHQRFVTELAEGYRVVSNTGYGEDRGGLATRFQLLHNDDEVARCHMTYKDGSWDASMGPTLEMLAVRQDRRGEGLAKVLWYHVRRFIETHFTLECLNNDAPLAHVMIKATQVGTNEVEIRKESDGSCHRMTFKEFLYDYCGFSVRVQKGVVAFMMGSQRPKDEEAILFIPLLKPNQPSPMKEPKPGRSIYREKIGKRMCMHCSEVGLDMRRCTRCGLAFYCGRTCQVADWKDRHKLWCNKSIEEVEQTLVERGDISVGPDGEKIINIRPDAAGLGDLMRELTT